MSQTYKLYYFDQKGRAEIIRLLLAYTEAPFEDVRLSPELWEAFKPKTPFGQLPVLEIDGQKMLAQTDAINLYLASLFDLNGSDNWEKAQIEMYKQGTHEFVKLMMPWAMKIMQNQEIEAEFLENLQSKVIHPFVCRYAKFLKDADGDFLMGTKVTLADFYLFTSAEAFQLMDKMGSFGDSFTGLRPFMESFSNIPQIKKHLQNRKPTPF